MKLSARTFTDQVKNPASYRAILLFGPDEGHVRERKKQLLGAWLGTSYDPLCVTELEESAISNDPALLADALSSFSLLTDRTVVWVRVSGDGILPALKSALMLESCQNKLLLSAGELSARSSLRKFFETETTLGALGCYADEAAGLEQLVRAELQARGITAEREVVAYLASQLGNDRSITLSELEKIDVYLHESRTLSRQDAVMLTGGNAHIATEDLCHQCASGHASVALSLCERLLREGHAPIAMLRALSYYFERLFQVKLQIKEGRRMEEALSVLRPPLFFKNKAFFEAHLKRFSAEKLQSILAFLTLTEQRSKRLHDAPSLLQQAVLTLCRL